MFTGVGAYADAAQLAATSAGQPRSRLNKRPLEGAEGWGSNNREIGRRTDVVGIFPSDRSLLRLAASVVIEQNDSVSKSMNAVRLDRQPRPRLAA